MTIQTIPSKDPMKERTFAYAAGLMDAEGCFSIYKPKQTGKQSTSYQPRIVLSSIDLPVIKWLVSSFGGFYTSHKPKSGKVWYQWNLNGTSGAQSFLSSTIPYIWIKKHEAQILQDFYSLYGKYNPEKRKDLMEQIKEAKNRECVTTETLNCEFSDKTVHAYFAGIVDGEGCISAAFAPNGKPMLRIRVGNNFYPLIQAFEKLYGGWHSTHAGFNNTKEFYMWELTQKELRERFLLNIAPYLRIKKDQAIEALKWVRLPKETERKYRVGLCENIRVLNSQKRQSELTSDGESEPIEMLAS